MSNLFYENPPITEAILDIRVEPRRGASAVEIAVRMESIEARYPNRTELPPSNDFAFLPDGMMPPMFGGGVVLGGFRYVSADERWILQARRDSFVLSFVGTKEERYPGWKDFEPEARRLWEAYREAWQPERITRIALRFVNQFSFVDNSDLTSDYLAMLPRFPRQDFLRDGAFSDYAFRILLPQGDIKADAVISHALITAPEARTVLDIDLFAEQEINAKEDTVLWERFTTLRHRKNELFQACITGAVEQSLEPRQA